MNIHKSQILKRLCYTELVYGRINKKLNLQLSKIEIEKLMFDTISDTAESGFVQQGKNIYVTNVERNIRITVNSHTFRIITADRIEMRRSAAR
jgi:biotin synthase-related radical SAM superfamily protein